MTTQLSSKVEILANIWLDHSSDYDFQEFVEYNDLGLPLAYAIDNNIVPATDSATGFILESFEMLLSMFDLEDTGFNSLDQILEAGKDNE